MLNLRLTPEIDQLLTSQQWAALGQRLATYPAPDIAEVRQSLRSFTRPQKTVSVKNVVSKVAEFYGIDEESIYEKTRRREVVRPRQVIMYLLREDFSVSYPTIGTKLGGRDHTTVIHSCEKIKREVGEDNDLAKEIQDIRTLLV